MTNWKNFFEKKFLENPSFIKESLDNYHQITLKDLTALAEINKNKFVELSNSQLIDLFLKARKHFEYNSAIDYYAWFIEKFFIPKLQKYLERKLTELNKLKQLPEYIATLVTPPKPSQIFIERKNLFVIIDKIRQNKELKEAIKNKIKKEDIFQKYLFLKKMLDDHLQKHNWLPVLVNNPPTILSDLWEEIVNFIKDDETFKIESKLIGDNFDENIVELKEKIIEELSPPPEILKLIKDVKETAFVRTEDNAVMSKSSYLIIPLYKEIAKRLGLTYYELKEFTPEEIVDYLQKGKSISKSLLKDRLKLSCHIVLEGERKTLVGQEAKEIKKIIEQQLKSEEEEKNIFTGTPVSLGKTTGKVKVALSSKEAMDIKKRWILVAPATSADFVPIMKKSRAIITELGGITSHAAVVSREFGIPCIIGVKQITKFLKDGDLIEVDANVGIVIKIEQD